MQDQQFFRDLRILRVRIFDHRLKFPMPEIARGEQAQNAAAQYGQMYAGLVLVMLPTLILYICVQKKLTQGMTLGGLKG